MSTATTEQSSGTAAPTGWRDLDRRATDTIRALAMDAVEEAGSGHPGTAMSLAPAAWMTFQRLLRHDPTDPTWTGRDRFVLSVGHSSLTLYIQLYLSGYGLTLDDLKRYRQWGSLTPGHPEYGHTAGVETTTGPLGQGISTAVGMSLATRYLRTTFDGDAAPGESVFDHTVWVFASDGDMQEGVQAEAASLAGHQRLGDLVVLYDDNNISIDGDTDVAFSEDVLARYRAYGWHTQRVEDINDAEALQSALEAARDHTDAPSIVAVRTIIAYPAPEAQDTGDSHGSALGAEEVAATKKVMGMDPDATFQVPDDVLAEARSVVDRGRALHAEWDERFAAWEAADADRAAEFRRVRARRLPDGLSDVLPTFEPGESQATRKASGTVLNALVPHLPELFGGSADLHGSNKLDIDGAEPFLPAGSETGHPGGRMLHFGIREHGMGAAVNGLTVSGLRGYGGTFLVFSDYMKGAVRISALMKLPSIWVWTHDSIALGGDGPTHQPVEHLAGLRAIPDLAVVRPADAKETAAAWMAALENLSGPTGLVLSRQGTPTLEADADLVGEGVRRGAYVLAEAGSGLPELVLLATGTEVALALEAREALEAAGTPTRVVSMPCWEWFLAQDQSYRQKVLPDSIKARVAVEAASSFGWHRWIGTYGSTVTVDEYGHSAPGDVVYEHMGFTVDRVVAAAQDSLSRAGATEGATTGN